MIWAIEDDSRFRASTLRRIREAEQVTVSAVSAWEISLKQTIGKLDPLGVDVLADLRMREYALLPISPEHAWAGGALPLHHRDPFDRILVAQAQLEGMTIVTSDPKLGRYHVAIMPA